MIEQLRERERLIADLEYRRAKWRRRELADVTRQRGFLAPVLLAALGLSLVVYGTVIRPTAPAACVPTVRLS
ncbi:hypothetical protein ABID82_004257 [Methylobacterium sp. PvP062]|uniref:Uncharacterized protein n=1 Tax=Methylobacterium radiotolerans TaxID=31998 RepID=A0ABV2NL81_9HYPH|nr:MULTISPECIES: hypothetical protein [unclassified Methylobacterium]KZC01421.1 hypothetical protein AU375_02345 [Methylobacterium radiotolerans]MBP2496019.1 hypothetical protein [Methylobacterium sp. PvP105]MBP2504110.1 hypothetical protein [Methylobacterium sp. PvP109]MCX7333100.1 hypothetical protein [Hyphomicrobiales bacterium]